MDKQEIVNFNEFMKYRDELMPPGNVIKYIEYYFPGLSENFKSKAQELSLFSNVLHVMIFKDEDITIEPYQSKYLKIVKIICKELFDVTIEEFILLYEIPYEKPVICHSNYNGQYDDKLTVLYSLLNPIGYYKDDKYFLYQEIRDTICELYGITIESFESIGDSISEEDHTNYSISISESSIEAFYDDNGEFHRDDDKPALIFKSGTLEWFQHGELHRDGDKPAITRPNGDKCYFKYGKLHRDNGPATIYSDGNEYYFLNGIQYSQEEHERIIR